MFARNSLALLTAALLGSALVTPAHAAPPETRFIVKYRSGMTPLANTSSVLLSAFNSHNGADVRAVLEAVGLDPDAVPPDRRAEVLLEIARQHRAMADGLRRLLMMRRDAKIALGIRSSQVEVGMNPLKWAPDADAAVEALLGPRTGSYKRGAEAIDDAVRALEAHQLALIGGVKAALRVALDAFDPAELERKLKAGGLSAVVPQLRRAELWDKFVENYEGFVDQANEDVRAVLGRELDKLYSDGTRDRDPLD